ncbi:ankyrin repeat and SAM domain-containing protein 4B isoform X2 [Denticeps clupeoides]|nr:ankyrin repeat and SAM domain-containing protein 4B-like isoform X2 [Denticeps clupeoides]
MTPTLLAAYHGQIEALQLICSRGGNADKSDIWGNTPLHHAASNGYMHILGFLVNFGANVFALDNDFHSPMDVAASRDHMDCVRFLDSVASQQTGQNAKKVARLKEQATKEAERRVKLCEKVKRRHQSMMDKMHRGGSISESSAASSTGTINTVNEQFSKLIANDTTGSLTARLKGTLQRKFGKKDRGVVEVQGDSNVIFVKQESGTKEEPGFLEVFNEQDENEDEGSRSAEEDEADGGSSPHKESIFKRPGLGNMVFRKNFSMEMGMEPEEFPRADTDEDLGYMIRREVFESNEDETSGYVEGDGLPWNQDEIGLDDQDEETSALDAFLSSISLLDFAPVFKREKLDLEALMLCSDDDLKSIRIQLGPRKKIMEAAVRRKAALEQPCAMKDTFL